METETRFDLNAAIVNWQQELAAQPDLTPVVRRVLESHLRDTFAEMQDRGLNNEESFWLAQRRTGRPQQVAEEFAKADPGRAWRDRAFWIIAFLLVENFWSTFWNQFFVYNVQTMRQQLQDMLPGWMWFYLPSWLEHNSRDHLLPDSLGFSALHSDCRACFCHCKRSTHRRKNGVVFYYFHSHSFCAGGVGIIFCCEFRFIS